jgi:3-oxoacyl-[acyl-carrier-protein] synthase III
MRYNRVYLESLGYELAPVVVSTSELERRIKPFLDAHSFPPPKLELLTGIRERRWWEPNHRLSHGATAAAKHALAKSNVNPRDIGTLIYAGVCREQYEPATACAVADNLGLKPGTIMDVSNACLGVLNGIVQVANQIELGQVKAGLVVSCESAREINDATIDRLNGSAANMDKKEAEEMYRECLATLTGGSGAVAVLVTNDEIAKTRRRRLLGGTAMSAPEHNGLCSWGLESVQDSRVARFFKQKVPNAVESVLGHRAAGLFQKGIETSQHLLGHGARSVDGGLRHLKLPFMTTHAGDVLRHGIELAGRTYRSFLEKLGLTNQQIDKVICHQVGSSNREMILKTLGIENAKDFSTFEYLGNIGTVSLPLTAALAEEREFLNPGDRVGFLGIGSGLNCMMLGIEW